MCFSLSLGLSFPLLRSPPLHTTYLTPSSNTMSSLPNTICCAPCRTHLFTWHGALPTPRTAKQRCAKKSDMPRPDALEQWNPNPRVHTSSFESPHLVFILSLSPVRPSTGTGRFILSCTDSRPNANYSIRVSVSYRNTIRSVYLSHFVIQSPLARAGLLSTPQVISQAAPAVI